VYVKQVHQKSNKCADIHTSYLLLKENKLWASERGAGAYITDTGFVIENCHFRGNRLGGLIL
jgi:hypothetical protein